MVEFKFDLVLWLVVNSLVFRSFMIWVFIVFGYCVCDGGVNLVKWQDNFVIDIICFYYSLEKFLSKVNVKLMCLGRI